MHKYLSTFSGGGSKNKNNGRSPGTLIRRTGTGTQPRRLGGIYELLRRGGRAVGRAFGAARQGVRAGVASVR